MQKQQTQKQTAKAMEQTLRAGYNSGDYPMRKTPESVLFEPGGAIVRFVEAGNDEIMCPVMMDIAGALAPKNAGWAVRGPDECVLVPNGRKWEEVRVATSLESAEYVAKNVYVRHGDGGLINTPVSATLIAQMVEFLKGNMEYRGIDMTKDFEHVFADDREELCGLHGTTTKEIDKLYQAIEGGKIKVNTAPCIFHYTQGACDDNEVRVRAMDLHAAEENTEKARKHSLWVTKVYKLRWGIEHLDFGDGYFREFSGDSFGAYLGAKKAVKLARARLRTVCRAHAEQLVKDSHGSLANPLRAHLRVVSDNSLPRLEEVGVF